MKIKHNQQEPGRLPYLDSSRGLASFAVMLAHFIYVFVPGMNDSLPGHSPLHVLWDGPAAVMYFFIHSGFILTYRLRKSDFQLTVKSYFSFCIRRVFRIYPLFLVVLLLTFLVMTLPLHDVFTGKSSGNWFHTIWQREPGTWDAIRQSLLMVRLPQEPELRLVPQDWSLSIEMAVSLMLPFLFFVLSGNGFGLLAAVYIAVQFLGFDKFAFDFTMGIVMVANYESFMERWKKVHPAGKVLVFAFALSWMTADHFIPTVIFNHVDLFLVHAKAWGAALVFLILLSSASLQKILSFPVFVFIGRISYGTYVLHLLILMLLFTSSAFSGLAHGILLACFILLVFAGAALLHVLVEKPMIRYSRKISSRMNA